MRPSTVLGAGTVAGRVHYSCSLAQLSTNRQFKLGQFGLPSGVREYSAFFNTEANKAKLGFWFESNSILETLARLFVVILIIENLHWH